MNNLTHKILLLLLFVTSSSLWAKNTTKNNDIPSSAKTGKIAILPPAPPSVKYINTDRCGYASPGDPRMYVLLEATGCGTGTAQWYKSDGTSLGANDRPSDRKFLETTVDVQVYATCVDGTGQSAPSTPIYVRYIAVPSQRPSILPDKRIACNDEVITLRSSINDPQYYYRWFRGVSATGATVEKVDQTTKGQGTPELKVTSTGWYFVEIDAGNNCPVVGADTQIFIEFFVTDTPKITASDTTFCQGNIISLKSDSAQYIKQFEWFIDGKQQDSLGIRSMIKGINKTSKIQVRSVLSDRFFNCKSRISAPISVRTLKVPAKPVITPSKKGAAICQGDTLSLTSSLGFKYKWSNGVTTPSVKNIGKADSYAVQVIDSSGCISPPSDSTKITIFKLPTKPVISASGPLAFCSGGDVTLTSSPNTTYIWSNKAVTRAITINASGRFAVAVRDANLCLSPLSDSTRVTVYALPAKPTITATGPLAFCADKSVLLTGSDLPNSEKTRYRWSTPDTTKSLTINSSATFTLRVLDPRNCLSPVSDPITTRVIPLPPAPTLTADGPLTFCARSNDDYKKPNAVNLIATSQNEVTWNTTVPVINKTLNLSAINDKGVFVDITGSYTATAKDLATGCISQKSLPLAVVVRNNPDATNAGIVKDGTFTLKAVDFPDGGDYEWRFNGDAASLKTFTDAVIKANRYGDYVVRRKIVYSVPAPANQLVCFSDFVKPFIFKEDPDFKGLSIYPNPLGTVGNGGLLTIETLADYENAEIIIYDILGRLIYSTVVPSVKGKVIVDLRNQTEGVYMLRFKANGFDLTKRIIIDK
jgi:Secretion system C-terminal sorting domain